MHITHGSTVTYKVVFERRWLPIACAAVRRARTSACAVGSCSATLALPAPASTRVPTTTTAPIGTSPRAPAAAASRIASSIQRRSASSGGAVRGSCKIDGWRSDLRSPPRVDRPPWVRPWGPPRRRASPRLSCHPSHPGSRPLPDTSSRRPRRSPWSGPRPTPSVRSPGTCSPACSSPSRRTRDPPSPATALHRSPACRASCVSLLALARSRWMQIAPPVGTPSGCIATPRREGKLRRPAPSRPARAGHWARTGRRSKAMGMRAGVMMMLSVAGPALAAAPMLDRIDVAGDEAPAVRLHLSAPVSATAHRLPAEGGAPARIYIDLSGAALGAALPHMLTGVAPVVRVRASQFDATTVRVVLDLERRVPFVLRQTDETITLELEAPAPMAAAIEAPAPTPTAAARERPAPAPMAAAIEPPAPTPTAAAPEPPAPAPMAAAIEPPAPTPTAAAPEPPAPAPMA